MDFFSDFALLLRDGYSRQKAIFLQVFKNYFLKLFSILIYKFKIQLVTAFAGSIGATIAFAYSTTGSCVNEINDPNLNLFLEQSNKMNLTNHIDLNFNNDHHGHSSFMLPFTIGFFQK